jgi:hypothetical protein
MKVLHCPGIVGGHVGQLVRAERALELVCFSSLDCGLLNE